MKVAIDTGPLTSDDKIRGVGAYTRELISALERVTRESKVKICRIDAESRDLSRYDVVHFPFFKPYFTELPDTEGTKTVVTIHDVIPLLYPKHYPPGIRGKRRLKEQVRRLKKLNAIITDSEASKKDIVRYLEVPQEKIYVTHLAQRKIFGVIPKSKQKELQKKYKLPKKFVLYVGDINYNKNVPALVDACYKSNVRLVIAGKQASDIGNLGVQLKNMHGPRDWIRYIFGIDHPENAHHNLLEEKFIKTNVVCTGFVPDTDLVGIYNLATVYCQPSYTEGFGLPVLEAMACGTPVVVARNQALVEVSEGAAVFANPKSIISLSREISGFLKSKKKRAKYSRLGFENVEKYSWEKTAISTLEIYKSVIND